MNKLVLLGAGLLIVFFVFNKTEKMPSDHLQVHNQDEFAEMDGSVGGRCSEQKCLTVYVAPWCPACASLKPTIISMAKELKSEGIDVKVIVGQDSLKKSKKYADKYPFPVLLDPDGKFFSKAKQKGVPFFLVSNKKGEIISQQAGGTRSVSAMRKKLDL